jgi:hypothetical protein
MRGSAWLFSAAMLCQVATAADALKFFKNYFVTGDYVVAGVGLRGKGVNGVAKGTITFEPNAVPPGANLVAAFLYWASIEQKDGEAAKGKFRGYNIEGRPLGNRTSPCWSSGGGTGASNGVKALRLYRADVLKHLPATNGKRHVYPTANNPLTVELADGGSGNGTPLTNGASLVVVYSVPLDPDNPTAQPPFRSVVLYDGAYTMDNSTKVFTQTVAGFYQASLIGPTGKMTHMVADGQANFNEKLSVDTGSGYIVASALNAATNPFAGAQGASWDNLTFPVNPAPGSASLSTKVEPIDSNFDCLSWGGVFYSATVQDTDKDGLLDKWETDDGFVDIADGSSVLLPDADPYKKDIYVELDYFSSTAGCPAPTLGGAHCHKPKQQALNWIRDAFVNAPTAPLPGVTPGVAVHFDVDDEILEQPNPLLGASVIGWKIGLQRLKNTYFPHNRRHTHRYGVMGHGLALFRTPEFRTTSGIADLPGGDFLATLGFWRSDTLEDDQVGSVLQQAGTIMHELGHTLNLRHAGNQNTPGCKPNYQSVMNYLFQTRGLINASGEAKVDYSRQAATLSLNEGSLNESAGLGLALLYRARWYGPAGTLDNKLNSTLGNRLAKRHCDGTPLNANETALVRIDAPALSVGVDWNNDLDTLDTAVASDANFTGFRDSAMTGFNDWANLDLQQTSSRRNAAGFSGDIASGDIASGDIASGDIASGDIASGDIASGDIASGDIASGDIASGVVDQLDLDYETATATVDAPTLNSATASKQGVTLIWSAPAFGMIRKYAIFREVGTTAGANVVLVGEVTNTSAPPATSFLDTAVKNNVTYTYVVTAFNEQGVQSPASNPKTVTVTAK